MVDRCYVKNCSFVPERTIRLYTVKEIHICEDHFNELFDIIASEAFKYFKKLLKTYFKQEWGQLFPIIIKKVFVDDDTVVLILFDDNKLSLRINEIPKFLNEALFDLKDLFYQFAVEYYNNTYDVVLEGENHETAITNAARDLGDSFFGYVKMVDKNYIAEPNILIKAFIFYVLNILKDKGKLKNMVFDQVEIKHLDNFKLEIVIERIRGDDSLIDNPLIYAEDLWDFIKDVPEGDEILIKKGGRIKKANGKIYAVFGENNVAVDNKLFKRMKFLGPPKDIVLIDIDDERFYLAFEYPFGYFVMVSK